MNTPESREKCADQIIKASGRADQMTAFVGLDGFVDEILHVVDKRESAERYTRLPTIQQFSERLAAAAGRSTNVELVSQLIKLGGNGPIMANALASFHCWWRNLTRAKTTSGNSRSCIPPGRTDWLA